MLLELSAEETQDIVDEFPGQLGIGAINGPRSTVLAGDHEALEKVAAILGARNVFCRIVKGSPPGHSHLVEPLKQILLSEISRVRPIATHIPIYSTVTARPESGASLDAHYWVRNLCDPVRFYDTVSALLRDKCDVLIEISPHPLLCSAVQDIVLATAQAADPESDQETHWKPVSLPSLRRDQDDHEILYGSLAHLYERGATVKWKRVLPKGGKPAQLPSYPWQRQKYWLTRTTPRQEHGAAGKTEEDYRRDEEQRRKVSQQLYSADWLELPRSGSRGAGKRWLLLASKDLPSDVFATALAAQLSGDSSQVVHTDGHLAEALDRARLNGMPWSGIVHCKSLDATPTSAMTEATLRAEPVPGAKSLIEVVRSLDASAWPGDPKLWIVTRGATAVHDADRPVLALAQTPVRGLARVIEAEQPTRYGSCVDLDAAATLPDQVVQFEAELVHGGDEPAVSLRGDKRFVQRLMRLSPTPNDSCVSFRAEFKLSDHRRAGRHRVVCFALDD